MKVVVEKGEDGYFVSYCPALRSCWSQGKTREEALANIGEGAAPAVPDLTRLAGLTRLSAPPWRSRACGRLPDQEHGKTTN